MRKSIPKIASFALTVMLACTFFAACDIDDNSVQADLESVTIEVHGYESGAAEIEVLEYLDEYADRRLHSLSLSAKVAWKSGKGAYTVSWALIGDDLGCAVTAIDPGCTGGTVAALDFGSEAGKITLRATASGKNQVTADLVIWVGQEKPTVKQSSLYRLQQACDAGILHDGDLHDIAFYNNGDYSGSTLSRSAFPKVPAVLSEETENKIKQAFLDDYYQRLGSCDLNDEAARLYTTDDITLSKYCGTYNGAVVVKIYGIYDHTQAFWTETVTGQTWAREFRYNDGNFLRVWFEEAERVKVPFTVKTIENTMGSIFAYESAAVILKEPFHDMGDLAEGFGFHLDYDAEFFAAKALVVYIFNATTTGGKFDVLQLNKEDGKLVMDYRLTVGDETALSYWTVILEVNQTDIVGIDELVFTGHDAFPEAASANLVEEYGMFVRGEAWVDMMPYVQVCSFCSDENDYGVLDGNLVCTRCKKQNRPIERHPYLSGIEIGFYVDRPESGPEIPDIETIGITVTFVTADIKIKTEFAFMRTVPGTDAVTRARYYAARGVKLAGNYALYATVKIGNQKQTFPLAVTVNFAH
jgi:hypothetical protein